MPKVTRNKPFVQVTVVDRKTGKKKPYSATASRINVSNAIIDTDRGPAKTSAAADRRVAKLHRADGAASLAVTRKAMAAVKDAGKKNSKFKQRRAAKKKR